MRNSFKWLKENLPALLSHLTGFSDSAISMINAHGDKFICYQSGWERQGILYEFGMAMCFMGMANKEFFEPNSSNWKDPSDWVPENWPKYKKYFEGLKVVIKQDSEDECEDGTMIGDQYRLCASTQGYKYYINWSEWTEEDIESIWFESYEEAYFALMQDWLSEKEFLHNIIVPIISELKSELFLKLEAKHGPEVASKYPEIFKASALLKVLKTLSGNNHIDERDEDEDDVDDEDDD